jgi:hypothetical protein
MVRLFRTAGGVILVEGNTTSQNPLVLAVELPDGTISREIHLNLNVSEVTAMFRYFNIRPLANAGAMSADDTGPASSYPLPAQPPNDPFQGFR